MKVLGSLCILLADKIERGSLENNSRGSHAFTMPRIHHRRAVAAYLVIMLVVTAVAVALAVRLLIVIVEVAPAFVVAPGTLGQPSKGKTHADGRNLPAVAVSTVVILIVITHAFVVLAVGLGVVIVKVPLARVVGPKTSRWLSDAYAMGED